MAPSAGALCLAFPGYADRWIGLHRAAVFTAIGGGVAIGESFTNFLPRLATVLLTNPVYTGVTRLTRWLLDAKTIYAHLVGFALVRNTGAAFFVLAFGAWIFGLALAIFLFKAGIACAGGAADGGIWRAVVRLRHKVLTTKENGCFRVLTEIIVIRYLVSLHEPAVTTAPRLCTVSASAVPNAFACVNHG